MREHPTTPYYRYKNRVFLPQKASVPQCLITRFWTYLHKTYDNKLNSTLHQYTLASLLPIYNINYSPSEFLPIIQVVERKMVLDIREQ